MDPELRSMEPQPLLLIGRSKMKLFLLSLFILPHLALAGATGEVLGDTAKGAAVGAAIGTVQTKVGQKILGEETSKKIGAFFESPEGILLMSGMATVYSGVLYNAAADQEEEAGKNIEKIDKIMAEFKDSYAAYCPNGREDLNVPDCYCYLSSGAENSNRSRSQICQNLWSQNKYKLDAKAGSYAGLSKFVDPVGCLNINGKFDENCNCKKFLNAKGGNACMKSVSIQFPAGIGGALMKTTGLKDVMQLAANTANGNPMFNNFSNGVLGIKAVATDNLKSQMMQQMAAKLGMGDGNSGTITLNEKNVGKLATAMLGDKAIAAAVANTKSALEMNAIQGQASKSPELAKAAAKAGLSMGGGNGLQNKKIASKENSNFSFGNDSGSSAGKVQEFSEQQKSYKYKGDISKDSDKSLFDIISNRYINTALRRLFEN